MAVYSGKPGRLPRAVAMALAVGLLTLGGCIKIRYRVQLNEDGTGRVLEELIFGEKLVNVSKRIKDAPTVEKLSSDERVKQRLASMGKGVSFVDRQVESLPDGGFRQVTTFSFQDISDLRLSPVPFGRGWEDACLKFNYTDHTSIANACSLSIQMTNGRSERPELDPLDEVEAQHIRQLLPIFKDLLEGFELSLRLEVFRPDQWAPATRGHPQSETFDLAKNNGRLTFYQVNDSHLLASEDGLLLVIPWRQVGREFDLYHHGWPPGPRIMPHINYIQGESFRFRWRAIQGPHGREYY